MRPIVAPFTGAWIETWSLLRPPSPLTVAPFTGAWIETSRPARGIVIRLVAPFTGAWIETYEELIFYRYERSLPSRERGLKLLLKLGVLMKN